MAVFVVSCNQGQEASKTDAPKSPAQTSKEARARGGTPLAKVNSTVITDADVSAEFNLLPYQVQEMFSTDDGMKTLLEEIIKKELLFQEASKRNYASNPKFRTRQADFTKRLLIEFLLEEEIEKKARVSDQEIKAYYEENKSDYVLEAPGEEKTQTLELEAMSDLIRQRLAAQKQQGMFDTYVTELKASNKVVQYNDAIEKTLKRAVQQKAPKDTP